ncbi:MAG: hypothetical protein NVV62_10260 [Terricaulis sp.]|nr:hypothetical protein [Terricaulis sp.]
MFWRNLQRPRVEAIVVSERYVEGAEAQLADRLQRRLHSAPEVRLQQLVSADTRAEVRSLVESALAPQTNTAAPVESLRRAVRAPTLAAWTDPASRTLYFTVAPVEGGRPRINPRGGGAARTRAARMARCIGAAVRGEAARARRRGVE